MPDSIDLYVIHRLDRRQPPEALAAQLTDELSRTDPRDTVTRSRIETARAVLGDPQRRAAYDQQLDDPATPPITEQTLASLSGRPAPTAPRKALSKPVAAFVAITAVVVVVALVGIVVALVDRDGDKDSGTAATATPSSRPSASVSVSVPDSSSASPADDSTKRVGDTFELGGLRLIVSAAGPTDGLRCRSGANYYVDLSVRNETTVAQPIPTAAGSPLTTATGPVAGTCTIIGDDYDPAPATIEPNRSASLTLFYQVPYQHSVRAVVIDGEVTVTGTR